MQLTGAEITDPLSAGRRRRVRLRLSGRRGPLHLRRALQAGRRSSTCWSGTSRAPCTPPTAIRARRSKIGVALVTSGPGVTNAVTGIATAYMDSIPMVDHHRPGADARDRPGRVPGMRHRRHHAARASSTTSWSRTSPTSRSTMKKAFYLATTGRPGPVLVDIPKDVTQATAEFDYPKTVTLRSYNPVTKGHAGQIKKAVQLLLEAKRPMVYTGGGVILNNAAPQLTRLVRLLGFPCTNTLMGLGGFPGDRPAVHRHARHARHLRGEHGDAELRRAARRRRALRRPRDRQSRSTSSAPTARSSTSTSTRRRSPSA